MPAGLLVLLSGLKIKGHTTLCYEPIQSHNNEEGIDHFLDLILSQSVSL